MDSLLERLDNYLVSSDQEQTKKYINRRKERGVVFYPYLSGKCSRQAVYKILGFPEPPPTPKLMRISGNGTSFHERYQAWFGAMGLLVYPEYYLKDDELRITGKTDGILRIDEELALLELKSCGLYSFEEMAKTGEPSEDYLDQLQLYLHLSGLKKGRLIVECVITERKTYIKYAPERDDFKVSDLTLEWEIDYDQEHATRVVEKIKKILKCCDNGILPERERSKDSFDCRFCSFHSFCWLGKELTDEELDDLVVKVSKDLEPVAPE